MRTTCSAACVLVALASPPTALACGGFFCGASTTAWTPPIVQAGERVLFSVDGDKVTAVVELAYEGRREALGEGAAFAWVIPLPAVPDVRLGPEALFNVLDAATAPRLGVTASGNYGCCIDDAMDGDYGGGGSPTRSGPPVDWTDVTLLQSARLGPYDLAVVRAEDGGSLGAWLEAHGFGQPPSAAGPLSYYVNRGSVFLAVRLVPDADAGALRPLALTYTSPDLACLPLILTSIATKERLPITVWLVGSARAVPLNYFHATLSDAVFPWECTMSADPGACAKGLRALLERVAEAGAGHAFVTELATHPAAGLPSLVQPLFGRYPLDLGDGLVAFAATLRTLGVPLATSSLDAIAEAITLSPDAPPECRTGAGLFITHTVRCAPFVPPAFSFESARPALDVLGFADERYWFERFASGSWLTRLSTVVAADDMTRDPFFGFNAELGELSASRTVSLSVSCKDLRGFGTLLVRGADNTERRIPTEFQGCGSFRFTGEAGEPVEGPGFALEVTAARGAPTPVALAEALATDARLALAVPGAAYGPPDPPDLPSAPVPNGGDATEAAAGGCAATPSGGAGAAPGAVLLLSLASLLWCRWAREGVSPGRAPRAPRR